MQTRTKEKDLTARYAMIPACFWMSYASIISYASYYLLSKGFSNTEIGIIVAAAGTIAAFLQPAAASFADLPQSPSLKKMLLVMDVCMVGCSGMLLICSEGKLSAGIGIVYAMMIILLQTQTPLVNALGTESINQGKKLNYGISRAMGSLGYAVMAFLLGAITVRTGSAAVPIGTGIIYICMILALLLFPFEKRVHTEDRKKVKSRGAMEFFLYYKRFSLVLIGCVCIYISHALINNFTLQIVQNIGGGSREMGVAQGIASLLELPTLMFFSFLLKKKQSDFWFRTSAIFFFVKTFATFLTPSLSILYLVQLFQPLGWGLMMAASVYYVNGIMEEEDAIKGQAYMTMTNTCGTVLGALLGGIVLDTWSVGAMLAAGSMCGFAGMLIILFGAEKTEI